MEERPLTTIDSKQEIKFPYFNSNYFIGTAGQKAFGRGDTVDRAHLSEAAFYEHFGRILAGISEAAEYGQVDVETTPNGRNEFYDHWQKAKQGRSPYTCIFIPWFFNPDYSSDMMTEQDKQGLSVSVQEMFAISDDEFIATLQSEEKELIARVLTEYNMQLTPGQMKWRRYKIWDKGDLFWQEYPEDDASCFLQSGRSVFTHIKTDESKRQPVDNAQWRLNEQYGVQYKKDYIISAAVDGAEGTPTGDRHVFSVIASKVSEDKAAVIYEYASNEPIDVFWAHIKPIIMDLEIIPAIEKNGVGVAHVNKARDLGIPHTEWVTGTNRTPMLTELEEAYRKENLIETYTEAENEARDMIYDSTNKPKHLPNKHDDRVFSRAIAWQVHTSGTPTITWV